MSAAACQALFSTFFSAFQPFHPLLFSRSPHRRLYYLTTLTFACQALFSSISFGSQPFHRLPSAAHERACLYYHFFPCLSTDFSHFFKVFLSTAFIQLFHSQAGLYLQLFHSLSTFYTNPAQQRMQHRFKIRFSNTQLQQLASPPEIGEPYACPCC